jgi:hypothetical protein
VAAVHACKFQVRVGKRADDSRLFPCSAFPVRPEKAALARHALNRELSSAPVGMAAF